VLKTNKRSMTMNHDSGWMNGGGWMHGGGMWVWAVMGLAIVILLIVVASKRFKK